MTKKTKKARAEAKPLHSDQKLPFLEHFKELKRRLTIVAVSVGVFSVGAYFIQHHIVELLLKPAEGQDLIYTTPGGGMNFLIQVCLYTGIVFSLPIIIYQILKYFEPLIGNKSMRFALFGGIISALLAVGGMAFGYFVGLPTTLHFLFHQFSPTSEIQPLIAVQSYMSFVTLYMFGAALLFQVPLVLIFINRIKRLSVRTLLKGERWFILGSFILAILMNPSPNLIDQFMLAGPMVAMYQVGIGLVWLVNKFDRIPRTTATAASSPGKTPVKPMAHTPYKHSHPVIRGRRKIARLEALHAQDAAAQAERLAKLNDAKQAWQEASAIAEHPIASMVAIADHAPPAIISAILTPEPSSLTPPAPMPVPVITQIRPTTPAGRTQERRYVDGVGRNRISHHLSGKTRPSPH